MSSMKIEYTNAGQRKFFVIISTGAYSDYDPEYFMGDIEITKEELDKKAIEIGDKLLDAYELLPEREVIEYGYKRKQKYDPVSGKEVYNPRANHWSELMSIWLEKEKGYVSIKGLGIPEVCAEYDVPSSRAHDPS